MCKKSWLSPKWAVLIETKIAPTPCSLDSFGAGVKVVRTARVPMGGWAEETQSALKHHETLPEESSEDELPPHVHRVKPVVVKRNSKLKYKFKFAS